MPRPALLLASLLTLTLCACGDGGLVGTWEPAATEGGLGSRTTFFADGSARIVTRTPGEPDEAYDARYTLAGDTLLALSDAQGTERFRLRLAGDTLVLASPATGRQTVLVRVGR